MRLPLVVLVLFLCHRLGDATPHSPFNRHYSRLESSHPSGVSYVVPPQFGPPRSAPWQAPPQQDNKFDVVYQWRIMDFEYPSFQARQRALASG